jgi:chromosome partitioning protein
MPLTIALTSQKGGSGKTTIALSLADALHAQGKRVLVVDADAQGTARIWADVGAERGVAGAPVIGAGGASMRQAISSVAEGFDVLLVDTPPRMSVEAKTAMALAHLVLVPVSPGPADVWALTQTAEALDEVRALRPDLKARIVLNRLDRRTALAQGLGESAAASGLEVLEAALGNRIAFPEAIAAGQGVTTYAPTSAAADEVRALLAEVLAVIGGQG